MVFSNTFGSLTSPFWLEKATWQCHWLRLWRFNGSTRHLRDICTWQPWELLQFWTDGMMRFERHVEHPCWSVVMCWFRSCYFKRNTTTSAKNVEHLSSLLFARSSQSLAPAPNTLEWGIRLWKWNPGKINSSAWTSGSRSEALKWSLMGCTPIAIHLQAEKHVKDIKVLHSKSLVLSLLSHFSKKRNTIYSIFFQYNNKRSHNFLVSAASMTLAISLITSCTMISGCSTTFSWTWMEWWRLLSRRFTPQELISLEVWIKNVFFFKSPFWTELY